MSIIGVKKRLEKQSLDSKDSNHTTNPLHNFNTIKWFKKKMHQTAHTSYINTFEEKAQLNDLKKLF